MQSLPEQGQYLELNGRQIYNITYGCEAPQARVLLCGPFPSDRLHSLVSWVRWARFLARNGVMSIRFDYSGTGESTGRFSETTFDHWYEDTFAMGVWMNSNTPACPLVLHGLGMGGLFAQKAFTAGLGNGLLLWSPANSARDVLNQALILRLSIDMIFLKPDQRKTAKEYTAELEAGSMVEMDGYACSSAMWRSSQRYSLHPQYAKPGDGEAWEKERRWRHVRLDRSKAPLITSASQLRAMNPRANVPKSPLNPDFSVWFTENLEWITALGVPIG